MPQRTIRLTWDAEYELKSNPGADKLAILLHGYHQSGRVIFNLLESCFDDTWTLLAPNGPFPVLQRRGEFGKYGFTWYFFDPVSNVYYHDMETSLGYLTELLRDLKLSSQRKTVVLGYSQGGYLAPFLAQRLSAVKQVISINSRYRSEALIDTLPFRIDALNGAEDPLVDPVRAAACHGEMIALGNRGVFRLVPGCGHGISREVRSAVRDLLRIES